MTESIIVEDINTTASIHEYLSELVTSNLRRQMTQIINPRRVILTTPHNGLLKPTQVRGNRRLNGVQNPFTEFLIPLAQTRGEDVVLPTIQLFWVTLIPRLLLLIPLT